MELVRQDGVGKGWAGKWLKVDLSYKVWKVFNHVMSMTFHRVPVWCCSNYKSDFVWSDQMKIAFKVDNPGQDLQEGGGSWLLILWVVFCRNWDQI